MRIVGIVLFSVGLALLAFVGFHFLQEKNKMVSPIPQEEGVKVIFVTPSP